MEKVEFRVIVSRDSTTVESAEFRRLVDNETVFFCGQQRLLLSGVEVLTQNYGDENLARTGNGDSGLFITSIGLKSVENYNIQTDVSLMLATVIHNWDYFADEYKSLDPRYHYDHALLPRYAAEFLRRRHHLYIESIKNSGARNLGSSLFAINIYPDRTRDILRSLRATCS